jgi:D-3-phosphoglycerate dehydrogenase
MAERIVVSDTKTADVDRIADALAGTGVRVDVEEIRTADQVHALEPTVVGLIVDSRTPVSRDVIAGLPDLRVVGRAGIGVDNVDVEAAHEHDVVVTNAPAYSIEEVSSHNAALLLAGVRGLPEYGANTRGGEWDWTAGRPLRRLREQTVGIVAFGSIARRFADKLAGFGCDLVGVDPYVEPEVMADHGVESVDLDGLRERADHLSVHAPLTPETRGLVDAPVLASLPEHGVVVNTGRGGVVDEAALADALDSGQIARAALDVMAQEPPEDPALIERDDVLVTPHTAWYSEESRAELADTVAADVARVLRGEDPANPVEPESAWN